MKQFDRKKSISKDIIRNMVIILISFPSLYSSCIGSEIDDEQFIISPNHFRSFKFTSNFKNITSIRGILVIGPSGSGKTTLINNLKKQCENVIVPKRLITRPPRLNDDIDENIYLTKKEFEAKIERNELEFYWCRELEKDRKEFYGFEKVTGNLLPIFSADNPAIYTSYVQTKSDLLILGVYAPDEVRQKRLAIRSPDILPSELIHRIKDPLIIDAFEKSHLVVNNFGQYEEHVSKFDIINFIKSISILSNNPLLKNF